MKHKHVKIYFFKNTPKSSNNGEQRINPSSCVVITISCISVLILKTGQATKKPQVAYRETIRRKVEKVDGELYNVEFATFEAVKDSGKTKK